MKEIIQAKIKTINSINGNINLEINSNKPTYFETETFEGYALLIARTNPIPTLYESLLGNKITFEVQVQGKFKRIPTGRVFVGADSDYILTLGIFLRSIVQVIIQFLSTFVSHVHYSLGHPLNNPNREITHLVAPLWSTMGGVIVTPPNEEPPQLGQTLPESPQHKQHRRQNDIEINLSDTYSFSMNSYNMDIISWNLIKVPLLQTIPLQTFTAHKPINLVAYEVPISKNDDQKYPKLHPINQLNYIFHVELKYFHNDNENDGNQIDGNETNNNQQAFEESKESFILSEYCNQLQQQQEPQEPEQEQQEKEEEKEHIE